MGEFCIVSFLDCLYIFFILRYIKLIFSCDSSQEGLALHIQIYLNYNVFYSLLIFLTGENEERHWFWKVCLLERQRSCDWLLRIDRERFGNVLRPLQSSRVVHTRRCVIVRCYKIEIQRLFSNQENWFFLW
jgi:hypothetical protein